MAFIDAENDQATSNKPLDELEIETVKDGGIAYVKALDPYWCLDRTYLSYVHPPQQGEDGKFALGAKEDWMDTMDLYLEDLKLLLSLPQHKFWSNMIFKSECMEMVLSFLQDAPPFYVLEEFPNDEDMMFSFQQVYHHVFLVIKRLATIRESQNEYMSLQFLGELIYENYIFTVPMILDLCLLYGRSRRSQVHTIVNTVFTAQPSYQEDVKKSIASISKSLSYVEKKFARTVTIEPVKLSSKSPREEITVQELKDIIIHVLDISSTLNLFLDICAPARKFFHQQMFCLRIVNFYENTIPEMYAQLEFLLNKDTMEMLHADLKHKLDVARVELLAAFYQILTYPLHCTLEDVSKSDSADIKKHVDDYCSILQECLSEKVFMRDYHSAHPVDVDLQLLSSVAPDVEDKRHYLMEAVLLSFDPPKLKPPLPARAIVNHEKYSAPSEEPSTTKNPVVKVTRVQLESLIAEVKDILSHLGDGFVQRCLEHYNYSSESVINAVLENSLPPSLTALDFTMPRIPPDETEVVIDTVERSNVFDNDEFDIMTRDDVDLSRIHKGKRKGKHKDLNQMLNDKSVVHEIREKYAPLGYVAMEERMYDDEYDDTYDHLDVSIDEPGGEPDRRPIVVPRVLRSKEVGSQGNSTDEEEDDQSPGAQDQKLHDEFVENPEVIRQRAEQHRQTKLSRGRGKSQGGAAPPPRDVVGGPKGQGQNKDVLHSRQKKSVNKSSWSNHNRKSGAQWKRSKSMVPS